MKDIFETLSYIVFIIATITTAIYFCYKELKKYQKRLDIFYKRSWSNEGCADCSLPSHFIDLRLDLIDNCYTGEIISRNLLNDTTFKNAFLQGKRNLTAIKADIFTIKLGERIIWGKVILKKKDNQLIWKLKKGSKEFFPNKTTMF